MTGSMDRGKLGFKYHAGSAWLVIILFIVTVAKVYLIGFHHHIISCSWYLIPFPTLTPMVMTISSKSYSFLSGQGGYDSKFKPLPLKETFYEDFT